MKLQKKLPFFNNTFFNNDARYLKGIVISTIYIYILSWDIGAFLRKKAAFQDFIHILQECGLLKGITCFLKWMYTCFPLKGILYSEMKHILWRKAQVLSSRSKAAPHQNGGNTMGYKKDAWPAKGLWIQQLKWGVSVLPYLGIRLKTCLFSLSSVITQYI